MFTHFSSTGIDFLHKQNLTGKGVLGAVVDFGTAAIPDLQGNLIGSYSVDKSGLVSPAKPHDLEGHGTAMAGIMVGTGASSSGQFKGIAPEGKLIAMQLPFYIDWNQKKQMYDMDPPTLSSAIRWLTQHKESFTDSSGKKLPLRVINMSIGCQLDVPGKPYLPPLQNPVNLAVREAWKAGIIVVTSAGNEGPERSSIHSTPANEPSIVVVGAADDHGTSNRKKATVRLDSSRGPTREGHQNPTLVAPGNEIIVPIAPGSLDEQSAHKRKQIEELSPEQLYKRLRENPKLFSPFFTVEGIEENFSQSDMNQLYLLLKERLPATRFLKNTAYALMGGTSPAAAYVTGGIMLLLESLDRRGKTIPPDLLKSLLKESCDQLANEPIRAQGSGYVDFKKAYFKINMLKQN